MASLLAEIEAFCRAFDLTESAFGTKALGDKHLVHQLRDGRQLRFETEQKVRVYMMANRRAA